MSILYVFIGGAFGALFRYLILSLFNSFPANVIGVFIVNIVGCFIIGFVSYISIKRHNLVSDNMNKMLTVGFAGGFTTFSAFTHPTLEMVFAHQYMHAMLNMFLSVIIGLIFVSWGMNSGYYLMNWLIRSRKIGYKQD